MSEVIGHGRFDPYPGGSLPPPPPPKPGPPFIGPFEDVTYKGETFVHCKNCNTYGRPRWAHMCNPSNWSAHPQELVDRAAHNAAEDVRTRLEFKQWWLSQPKHVQDKVLNDPGSSPTLRDELVQARKQQVSEMRIVYGIASPSAQQPTPPAPDPLTRQGMIDHLGRVVTPQELANEEAGKLRPPPKERF